jgi:aryl sulfotransferase
MHTDEQGWPIKTRNIRNHHMDSTIWDEFRFRDDDIVIATYAKSGTTWVQQIVSQLLFHGATGLDVAEMSPWLDLRVPPKEVKLPAVEAQAHRRFLKTHLPVDALVYSPKAKYIYIGRDGRDVMWSMHNHFANANELLYQLLNDTPAASAPPCRARPPTRAPGSCTGSRPTASPSGPSGRTSGAGGRFAPCRTACCCTFPS